MYLINVFGHLYESTSSSAAKFESLCDKKDLNVETVLEDGIKYFDCFRYLEIDINYCRYRYQKTKGYVSDIHLIF